MRINKEFNNMFIKKIMKILIVVLLLSGLGSVATPVFSLGERSEIDLKAAEAEAELDGFLTLRFLNALNGEPIIGGSVTVASNETSATDSTGKILFAIPEDDGRYSVNFEMPGFITTKFEIEIAAGTMFANWFSISPALELGNLRMVLDWGKKPRDLDVHLVKKSDYHISYRKMRVSSGESARLDRDDTNGYGPETITIRDVDEEADYIFYVHDYSNRSKKKSKVLSKSTASLKIYGGNNELLNIFPVSKDQKGNYWHVFSITKGQILPVGTISQKSPE